MKTKNLFRINFLRNHFLRYGLKGLWLYFKIHVLNSNNEVRFVHREYKRPVWIRKNTSDVNIFYQILFNKDYDISLDDQPEVIVDLGANVGYSSIYFLNRYPNCKVVAVEPEVENYKNLLKNTEGYSNFFSYNNAIWHKNSKLILVDNNNGSAGISVMEALNDNMHFIQGISLGEIIAQQKIEKIDVLKIDIEGSEIELFSKNFVNWLKITRVIIIELHDWMRPGCSKQFFSSLMDSEYKLSHKGENLICYIYNK